MSKLERTVRLDENLWQALQALAQKEGRSANQQIVWILRDYVTRRASAEEEETK